MIKINKFLAASVVTLSLAACDLAPYSSIAVYADQAAKVVCDERYWVAARSDREQSMSWSTSFQTARILLFLSRPQVQTARCGTRQSTIWQQIMRSVSAI